MFFSENTCSYCQPLSATLPVTLLFLHPLAEMLKCCFCGSKGASMTDFHDLQLKQQLLLQQKWEDGVAVEQGNVCDSCVRPVKPNKFFDKTPVAAHQDEPGQRICRPVATFLSALFLHDKRKDSIGCRSEPSDKKCKKLR